MVGKCQSCHIINSFGECPRWFPESPICPGWYTHQQHTRTTQARPSTLWPPNNPAFTWLSTPVPTAIADRKISQKKRWFCFCTKSAMVNVGGYSEFHSVPFRSLNFGRRFSSQLLMIADAATAQVKYGVWQQDQGCQAPTTGNGAENGHNSRWVGEKRSTRKSPRFVAQRNLHRYEWCCYGWLSMEVFFFVKLSSYGWSRFLVKSQVLGLLCQLRLQTMHYSKLYAPRSVWKKGYGPQIAVSFAVFWMRKWWLTNGSSTYSNKPMADQAQSVMLPIFSTKTGFPTVIFFRRKTYTWNGVSFTHLPGWRYLLLLGFSRNMTETTSVGTWELAKFSQKKALQGLRTSSNHIKWRAQQKTGPSIPVKAQGFSLSKYCLPVPIKVQNFSPPTDKPAG